MSVVCLIALAHGEKRMSGAKTIDLGSGIKHLPQHYATYHHTLKSVEAILSRITFSSDVLLFTDHDENGLYVQVGIIGHENYRQDNLDYPPKIVYGRKWRIDTDTPTSEIIQTVMLAIKKVREHEIRELFVWLSGKGRKVSVPLSCHQDISMLKKAASVRKLVSSEGLREPLDDVLGQVLNATRFLGKKLIIERSVAIDDKRVLVDFKLDTRVTSTETPGDFKEFNDFSVSLLLDSESVSKLAYLLLDSFIAHSDRYVEETFAYEDFHRFSRVYSLNWIAKQSRRNRPYKRDMADETFKKTFEETNYETDKLRKPSLGYGLLAEINEEKIARYPNLEGHLPSLKEPIEKQKLDKG